MTPELTVEPVTLDSFQAGAQAAALVRWRDAGERLARSIPSIQPKGRRTGRPPNRRRQLQAIVAAAAADAQNENRKWLVENARLIFTGEKETRDFAFGLRDLPVAVDSLGTETPRVCHLARGYLEHTGGGFCEEDFVDFVEGYQQVMVLDLGEVWALKPALEMELIDRLANGAAPEEWPALLTG